MNHLEAVQAQKQQVHEQIVETKNALKEVKTAKTCFRILNGIMVSAEKEKLVEELTEKQKILEKRMEELTEQEETLKEDSNEKKDN
tara:strand:+ start:1679 stop:1936 length:258 start_codon:yes stop_codon:yes gene_type:complete